MEELKTTETLDREILEDARKKAYKILKTADDTIAAQDRDWKKKTGDAIDSIRKAYAARTKKTEDETLARLPLDKRRLRSEYAEALLGKASEDFLRGRKREGLLEILEKALFSLLLHCVRNGDSFTGPGGGRPELRYSAMGLEECKTLMKRIAASLEKEAGSAGIDCLGSGEIEYVESGPEAVHEFPAIAINAGEIRLSVSVEAAAAAMVRDNRAELASALMGKGVLDD